MEKRQRKSGAVRVCDFLQAAIHNARNANVRAHDVRFSAIYLWTRRAYMIDGDTHDAMRAEIRSAA